MDKLQSCLFVLHSVFFPLFSEGHRFVNHWLFNAVPLWNKVFYLLLSCGPQSQRGQDQSSKSSGSKAGPNTESVPDPDQDITTTMKTGNKQMKLVSEKSLGLDQAILHSINCCRKLTALQFVNKCNAYCLVRVLVKNCLIIASPVEIDDRIIMFTNLVEI